MKLIHCADLHLDSPLAVFPPEQARERRAELLDTFRRMVEFAAQNDVEAILIAGDLFDSVRQIRKRTIKAVREIVLQYPQIHFFYLSGNHDEGAGLYSEAEPAPENFHTFQKSWTSYRLGEVTVTSALAPKPDTLLLDAGDRNIVLLHGPVVNAATGRGDEIPLRAYAGKNIDYLALGHYHSFSEYPVDDRAVACYCGCPEGRGFDECGEKGFLLLETAPQNKLTHRFVPFAERELHEVPLDMTGCTDQAELEKRAEEALAGIPGTDLVLLVSRGEVDPVFAPDFHRIDRTLASRFWFARRKDETSALIRPEDYRNDQSLKGEFIRLVCKEESLSDTDRDAILRNGLRALYREEIDL